MSNKSLQRLCALVREVERRGFSDSLPHDCFCGDNPENTNPVIAEEIVDFIEQAIMDRLRKKRDTSDRVFLSYEYERVRDAVAFLSVLMVGSGRLPWKIAVIKQLREQFGYGIKDGKNLVETACEMGYIKEVQNSKNETYYTTTERSGRQ